MLGFYDSVSKVNYNVSLNKDKDLFKLSIITDIGNIYKSSDNKTVLSPPYKIDMEMNILEIIEISSYLIEGCSQYLNPTNEVDNYNVSRLELKRGNYILAFKKVFKKGRKIILDIYKDEKLIISLGLGKNKIFFFLKLFKSTFKDSQIEDFTSTCKDKNSWVFNIVKKDKYVGINNIWLQEKEKQEIRFLIETLIFDHRIKDTVKAFSYRQIALLVAEEHKEVILGLRNITKKDEKPIFFEINALVMASFYYAYKDI